LAFPAMADVERDRLARDLVAHRGALASPRSHAPSFSRGCATPSAPRCFHRVARGSSARPSAAALATPLLEPRPHGLIGSPVGSAAARRAAMDERAEAPGVSALVLRGTAAGPPHASRR
jgi:hypothetical protein